MNVYNIAQMKRLRGAVLTFVYSGHRQQESRLDDVGLWGLMQDMQFDVGQDDVITLLQDLKDRQLLSFNEKKNRRSNRTEISLIQITAKGRDLVEGTVIDAAVVL